MSNQLLELLQGHLTNDMIGQLSNQLGGEDKERTSQAVQGILSTLLTGLAKNASSIDGASALNDALEKDHDGSLLDHMGDLFSGNIDPVQNRAANGEGIINHILGDKKQNAVDVISKLSGLNSGKTTNLMTMLAPILMGALGKTKQQNGLDVAGLISLLSGTVSAETTKNPQMGFIAKFLDSDNDGSIIDDVANIGFKMLGGLFGRK